MPGPKSGARGREASHVRAAGRAVGPRWLGRKLLAERAEPRQRPLERLGAAGGVGVPGGSRGPLGDVSAPVGLRGNVLAPVGLRGNVQAPRLEGGRAVERNGLRRVPVASVGGGRAARVRQRGVEAVWGRGGGARDASGEGGGGGARGGRLRSARTSRQSGVTQRDAVEALTRERRTPVRYNQEGLLGGGARSQLWEEPRFWGRDPMTVPLRLRARRRRLAAL